MSHSRSHSPVRTARAPPREPRGAAHRTPAASAPRRSRERAGRSLPAAGARCPRAHPPDGPPGVRLHHPGAVQVVVVGRRVARRQEAARAGCVDPAAALRCKRQTDTGGHRGRGSEPPPLPPPRPSPAVRSPPPSCRRALSSAAGARRVTAKRPRCSRDGRAVSTERR